MHGARFILAALLAIPVLGPGAQAQTSAEQFCKAAGVFARAANADAGIWLDRYTRNDGVEVICDIRTVHFRRFYKGPQSGPGSDWVARKRAEWNSVNCADRVWRAAIEQGWIILESVTTAAGGRASFIATCK
jgi:hypothetical protein